MGKPRAALLVLLYASVAAAQEQCADIEVDGDADRMHLSHWVAGTIANAAQIAPLNGSASFSGHAVGTINDSGVRQFVADMTTSYDFGTRSGSVNITNLEGQNFQYTINGINGSEHTFSGALTTAPSPDFTGNTRGAFYNDGASIAQGVGGDFYWRDTDTAASAVGVFVGQR